MKLKSFKGMPHELGGIDYTEGAEVEGGEYAVKIGTSGNEYIFDKESSEGDFLAKEYKKLNSNSRLLEDDPIALATFEQIARDQALTHAQRSVNEKGVDPFRNMYEKGQAKNGGVKYATGGPVGYNMDESSEDRMRTTSFGDQEMRIEADTVNRKDIPAWKEAGLLMGDIFLTPVTSAFTGKSFSEMAMADSGYRSSEATRRAFGDDTMTGTAFGVGFAESEGVISNLGSQFFSKQGGALPKDKYAQGGASGQKDMYMGGGGYMQLFEGIHNVRQGSKQIAGPAIDNMYDDQRYVRQPIAGPPTTSGGGSLGIPQKQPQEEQGGLDPQYFDQEGNPWMMDEGQLTNMPVASESPDMITGDAPIDLGGSSAFGGFKNGGAKKGVYGYYANGGGIDTLHSGITYQDLQGGRSYPVYDNNGNEIQGRRNIGASSLSPGFDIQENFIPRESTPQGYVPVNHDPYGNYDLNEESHFMHLRKPPRQSKLTRDLNAEQGFNLYADPVKNAPNVKSTSTLINNETGESYNFKNGGGKKANSNNAYEDYLIAKKKELAFKAATEGPYGINYSDVMYGPSQIEGRTDMRTEINNGNVNQSFNQASENRNIGASSLSPGFDVRIETDALNGQANQKFFTRNNATGDISTNINGITQFQNGGGKKKEESYDAMKDPVQWDIMQNYIASNDTRDRMSQAAVGSGDEMYAPYRVDNTCVAGVNCFEDLAGIPSSEGIPDNTYNNRLLKDFFESEEGKKLFRKAKNEKPGDYVQFEKKIRTIEKKLPNGEIVNIPTGQFNYPFHLGMVTGDDRYLGDGSSDNPLYYTNINKEPSIQVSNLAGLDLEFNNINPNFYRMRDKKNRKKVIDAALQAKQQGKDVIRPTLDQEATGYLPLQQYRKNSQYPIAGL